MTGPDKATRSSVLERDHGRCVRCGQPVNGPVGYSIHHRIPRQMGGTRNPAINLPENLLTLCGTGRTGCHGWVESHRAESYEAGWLVHSYDDPETVPVQVLSVAGPAWFILDGPRRVPLPTTGDAA